MSKPNQRAEGTPVDDTETEDKNLAQQTSRDIRAVREAIIELETSKGRGYQLNNVFRRITR